MLDLNDAFFISEKGITVQKAVARGISTPNQVSNLMMAMTEEPDLPSDLLAALIKAQDDFRRQLNL